MKTYDPYVEHHGWTAQVAAIRQAFAARDTDAMGRAVTDDMLEAIAVCGTPPTRGPPGPPRRLAAPRRRLPRSAVLMVSERRGQRYALASLALLKDSTS